MGLPLTGAGVDSSTIQLDRVVASPVLTDPRRGQIVVSERTCAIISSSGRFLCRHPSTVGQLCVGIFTSARAFDTLLQIDGVILEKSAIACVPENVVANPREIFGRRTRGLRHGDHRYEVLPAKDLIH